MATQNLGRVGLVLKGEWDSATAYTALDVVSHDGNAWAAKQNSTNVEPTTGNSDFWQLFSNNADLVATVQGLKEDAANSATSAAASAADAEASAQYGEDAFNAIAHTFDPGVDYTAGKYVWYDGELYRFNVAHPAGTWIGTDAARYTATDELPLIEQALGTKADATEVAEVKNAIDERPLTPEEELFNRIFNLTYSNTQYGRTVAVNKNVITETHVVNNDSPKTTTLTGIARTTSGIISNFQPAIDELLPIALLPKKFVITVYFDNIGQSYTVGVALRICSVDENQVITYLSPIKNTTTVQGTNMCVSEVNLDDYPGATHFAFCYYTRYSRSANPTKTIIGIQPQTVLTNDIAALQATLLENVGG